MTFQIAPFRALRFDCDQAGGAADALTSPPYDIIGPREHRQLLERSAYNIVRLTLGEEPGEKEDYARRGERVLDWKRAGILVEDSAPAFYVYGVDYTVPGTDRRATFRGLAALGRLHPFEERVVLPHEHTFAGVVDDRYRLLEATRTQLEPIFLLYEDAEREIDAILDTPTGGEPCVSVEGKPGETHSLWPIRDAAAIGRLRTLFAPQRPIIADGHHRYTTALLFRERNTSTPGSSWQPMVFANLIGDGLSILATHRLLSTGGRAQEAMAILEEKLDGAEGTDETADTDDWDYQVETREATERVRIPDAVRRERRGAAASDYAILHDLVIGEWLRPLGVAGDEAAVSFFKEGSGEREALESGAGDVLFRMRPVSPREFRNVVDGGEVFPHKTTFFYPKLWSGLFLWSLSEPAAPGGETS